MNQAIKKVIWENFKKAKELGLKSCPKDLVATGKVWVEVIDFNYKKFDEEDVERFDGAFKTYFLRSDTFPKPSDIVDLLPKKKQLLIEEKYIEPSDEDKKRNLSMLNELVCKFLSKHSLQ